MIMAVENYTVRPDERELSKSVCKPACSCIAAWLMTPSSLEYSSWILKKTC